MGIESSEVYFGCCPVAGLDTAYLLIGSFGSSTSSPVAFVVHEHQLPIAR
jgi:hypothetical protein